MPADIATLLAEAPWLARLARSLTGDPAEADDLVQDTYAAALRSPPETDRPIRPWLRRVAINLARMRHRVRTRRAATESVVETQVEPVRDAEQLLERARLERRLAELVLELDEPFRTTVLLRYREGLSAEHIANQQGIPAATVRSRLKTALDRVRRELAADEKRQLHALFAPLALSARHAPAQTAWRLVMAKLTSKLAIVIAVLLLLLAGTWLVWPRGSSPARAHIPTATSRDLPALIARPAMFVQAGVGARAVRGRVTSDGIGYRGAVVQLVHAQTEVVVAEVRSGADGAFELGDRPADLYVVTASAPARAATPVQVDLRKPATSVELRLTGCSHLRGMVVDGSGVPIAHARIARDDAPGVFAETDDTGHYDLCARYGNAAFRYAASGYHGVVIDIDVAANSRRDVVLVPEAIVEGTVVDEHGATVGGAWIVIEPPQVGYEHDARATGFSAADGSFRIAGVAPGRNLVAGFAPGLRSWHKQELVAGAAQVTSGVVVRLARSAAIAGVVVSGGAPVAGVGVGMRVGNHDETGVLAVTQADGSFVIDRAPRGVVALYVENHTVIAPRSVRIGDTPHLRIEVQRMGSVHGRVVRGGEPVADAQVTCPGPQPRQSTDASGAYTCDAVDDGPQEVTADVPSGEWGTATVTITRGERASLDVPLTLSGAICGRIVDERGAPVGGLEIRVSEVTTGDLGKDITAGDGAFCTRLLTGGTYNVVVFAGPRAVAPVQPLAPVVLGPREHKTIAITVAAPTLSISGIVSEPRGGPVVDAIVRLVVLDHGAPRIDARVPSTLVVTDEAGRFTLSKLAPGDYALVATARDGSAVTKSPVAAGTRDVSITLAAAGRIEGELVGFTSTPTITGAAVNDRVFLDMEVDGNRFRASGLSPGPYVLMALTDSREADTRQVVVRPGQPTHVTLTSRGTSTVTGVVRDFRTRAPVTGMRCSPFARDGDAMGTVYAGPDEGAPTDAQGGFRLTAPAGEIQILCGGAMRIGARMLTVSRDRTTVADVLTVPVTTQEPGTIDAELAFASNRVVAVAKAGAAERAGLAVGDEILAVDGLPVGELFSMSTMLLVTQRPVGATAQLTIQRGAERRSVVVTVSGR